jgi:hypothetical protein
LNKSCGVESADGVGGLSKKMADVMNSSVPEISINPIGESITMEDIFKYNEISFEEFEYRISNTEYRRKYEGFFN